MPAILANSTVLVTGASGFQAAHVCDQLVRRGHHVVGTVRSEEKGKYLQDLFGKIKGKGTFTYVIVEDIEQEGGFDEAITKHKVDGIAHVASPFHFRVEDPYKDLVDPAVNGTRRLLESAYKCGGTTLKRVVITSSFAAMINPPKPGQIFSEEDWNTFSPEELEKKGKDIEPVQAYRASKTLAERAAWQFQEERQPRFDIATINPPLILGPIIHQVDDPSKLNTSVGNFYKYYTGTSTEKDLEGGAPAGCMVNVVDVAHAHVEALLRSEGTGRFAVSSRKFCWQDVVDELHSLYPQRKEIPVGKPGSGKEVNVNNVGIDASRAKKILFDGKDYIGLRETIVQMVDSLTEKENTVWRK